MSVCAQETQRQYLSGHGKDDAVSWRFLCTTGALSGIWTNIPVPSNWELHGFGHLTYKKDYSNAITERGLYEKDFSAPADWNDKRVFLVFEGAMTDTSAKLNGQSVGPAHQGGFYRFKYEVTKLVRQGATNLLEVEVAKHSANQSVNKAERLADYWVFGGIYRPVYLEAVPQEFIERVAIDARGDGAFAMDVFVNGVTDAASIEAQIQTPDGRDVGLPFSVNCDWSAGLRPGANLNNATNEPGRRPALRLQTQIVSPQTWSAETPNLYNVEVRLKRGNEIVHRFTQRFGFRTFEVRDGDGLYLNGNKIILKGVNRHSFWPDSGRCLSEAVQRLDIETIKDMNGNAVRMSHYPPDAAFLDLCDELGIYVLDELAGWHNKYDTEVGTKLVEAMVTRDVNHPSILFWNNGNEGGFNTNLDNVFLQFDPQQRRVLHPWASFNGLCTAHYLAFDKAEIAASGKSVYFQPPDQEVVATNDPTRYIYMPTEIMHGLYDGGAGAGLEDYWRMMMSYSNCAGGFIWTFLDEGVKRPDTGIIDTAGNQAPDGIVGPYREREGSFYAIKEIWSPIQITRASNDTFTVENRFSFTDANQCTFRWQLWRLPMIGMPETTNRIVAQGVVRAPQIPPGSNGVIQLDLPRGSFGSINGTVLALRVDDPSGRQLGTWTWPEMLSQTIPPFPKTQFPPTTPRLKETADVIEVATKTITLSLSKRTGMLIRAGDYSITNGPRPAIGNAILKSISSETNAFGVTIKTSFDGGLQKADWHIRDDGWIVCHYTYRVEGTNDAHGVMFDYPEELVRRKKWLGNGPFRVWKNRTGGGTLNVWENEYNNTVTGHNSWVYPEFKGVFSDVHWLQLETTEGLITVIPGDVPYVQVLTPEQPPDNLIGKTKVNLPRCGLAFLHAIPPIGTKFKAANTGGPQGQPNVTHGEFTGSVSFYFGKLP